MPLIVTGNVIHVEEPDYLPGVGPLRLRITAVGEPERHADGVWLNVRGISVELDGSPVNGRERYVLVRLAALNHLSSVRGRS